MKKTYSKPEILFEDFSVSANISAGCEYIMYFNSGECKMEEYMEAWGTIWIFTDDVASGCNIGPSGDDSVCYNVPENGATFTS